MELLKSLKFEIPKVFFITDKKDISKLPIGIPYIVGDIEIKKYVIRLLEYEVIYQSLIKTGLPFDWDLILKEHGYKVEKLDYYHPEFEILTDEPGDFDDEELLVSPAKSLAYYIEDSNCYVKLDKIKQLKIIPTFLSVIEEALVINMHNFVTYNFNLYHKNLDGIYGGIETKPIPRSVIVIDISASIPKAVSSTILALAKTFAETFFTDILITSAKSTLYLYEELHLFSVEKAYEENGMSNEQRCFKKLMEVERHYETAIVFGDNHNPGMKWNLGDRSIFIGTGKKLCKWKVNKVISFHVNDDEQIAGYGLWFSPKQVEKINNWVHYLKK